MSRNEHKAFNGNKTDMTVVCVLPLEIIKKTAEEPFLNPKQNFSSCMS